MEATSSALLASSTSPVEASITIARGDSSDGAAAATPAPAKKSRKVARRLNIGGA
jgi:hypothetical protein